MDDDFPKVLIIEDNEELLDQYEMKLIKEGFQVVRAFDGEEGIHKARNDRQDIILLDILLPHIHGIEVLRRIREGIGSKVPVIVLSNINTEEIVNRAYELGVEDYIVKANVDISNVIKKIKGLFKKHYSDRAHHLE